MTGSNALLVPPEVPRVLDPDELYRQLMQIVGRDAGLSSWGSNIYHTSYESDSEYAHTIQNQGTGGHLNIPGLLAVTDSGVAMGALSVTNLLVSGTLGVTGTSTLGVVNSGALTSSGLVKGTQFQSTVTGSFPATGSPPLIVASSRVVNNLNANYLEGHGSGDFALLTGAAFTGAVSITPTNDQALLLRHTTADGVTSIGSTHSSTPDLIVKNNAGTQIGRFTDAGLFMAGAQTSPVSTAGAADAQVNDLWLVSSGSNFRRVTANGSAFQISGNADVGTHMTIDTSGVVTIGELVVDNNGIDITGSSDFQSATTFHNGISVSAGNVFFPNTTTGFFGSGGATKQAVGAAATDLATVITLANNIRNALQNLGLSS